MGTLGCCCKNNIKGKFDCLSLEVLVRNKLRIQSWERRDDIPGRKHRIFDKMVFL